MAEPVIPGGTPPTVPDSKGKPPVKGENGGQNNPTDIDFSKLTEDQLLKVLENENLWKLPRIKELQTAAKKAKKFVEDQATAETEGLKKQGEFEKLAAKNKAEADNFKSQYQQSIINNKILQEAGKQGITRLDLVDKLVDKASIKLDEDGNATGITEAITKLITDNDFLKTGSKNSLGGGTNPAGGTGQGEFTITQIQDPVFYQAHAAEILKAQATGHIIDDRK